MASFCPADSKVPGGFKYSLRLENDTHLLDCALPCQHGLLGQHEKALFIALIVVGALSLFIMACLILTYLLNRSDEKQFKYPEKITIYILFCHFFISQILLIGATNEQNIGCHTINETEYKVQGNNKVACTVMHMFLLFFFLASQIWSVIYAICVYLMSKYEYAPEQL